MGPNVVQMGTADSVKSVLALGGRALAVNCIKQQRMIDFCFCSFPFH